MGYAEGRGRARAGIGIDEVFTRRDGWCGVRTSRNTAVHIEEARGRDAPSAVGILEARAQGMEAFGYAVAGHAKGGRGHITGIHRNRRGIAHTGVAVQKIFRSGKLLCVGLPTKQQPRGKEEDNRSHRLVFLKGWRRSIVLAAGDLHIQGAAQADGTVEEVEGGDQGNAGHTVQRAHQRRTAAIEADVRAIGARVLAGGTGL